MGEENTPPVSPSNLLEGSDEELEPDQEEMLEVIDLDEEAGLDDEENEFENEGETMETANEPVEDQSALVFSKHTGSVFCCDLSHNGTLAVSGGEDDRAFVWDVKSGDVLFECSGHKDSVTSAVFSHDDTYVATGDMSGNVQVWKIATKKSIWQFEADELSWLEWHQGSHVLLAGTMSGEMWMWKIPSGDCKTFQGHGERNECGKILPDGKRAAAAYSDGTLKVFDLKTGSVIHQLTGGLAHKGPITCLDVHRDNKLIITGSTDGTAKLYNTQTGKVLATFVCAAENAGQSNDNEEADPEDSPHSVESVSFCPDPTLALAATATLSGAITFWDIPTQIQRQTFQQEAGVVKSVWLTDRPVLITAGLDGVVRFLDARTGQLERSYTGHNAGLLDLCLSRDGSVLLTSSDDQTCRIFNLTAAQ